MRVDLRIPDTWHKTNAVYHEALALGPGGYGVQSFLGVGHALWEVSMQLAQLQPNKRTVVFLKESSPVFETVAVHLSREGFRVRALTEAEMRAPAAWLDAALKDLLFVFSERDDPVTGELFELAELDDALREKRLYRLRVSHSWHTCFRPRAPGPQDVQILSLAPGRAVALTGERIRVSPPVAADLTWPEISKAEAEAHLALGSVADPEAALKRIESFEASAPAGGERVLAAGRARLPDRAVIAFRDVDGLALASELARSLGFPLAAPGEASQIETTSLCRWSDERVTQALLARGFAPEVLRGMLILGPEPLSRPGLADALSDAKARVVALQDG